MRKTGWILIGTLLCWIVLIAAIFGVFKALEVVSARAHSWYDPACCNGNDCAEDDRVKEVKGGFLVPTGETVPYGDKRIRQSLDKQFHWCHVGSTTYCVYIPGGAT